jgi:hypothetical protein
MRTQVLVVAIAAIALARSGTAQDTVTARVYAQLRTVAGRYPLRSVSVTHGDSAVLTFEDSTFGRHGADSTWMFGPPVTAEEAYGCPLPKVLGRKLARVFYRGIGKEAGVTRVIVRVRGTIGLGRLSSIDMYYGIPDLVDSWVGDKGIAPLGANRELELTRRDRAPSFARSISLGQASF